MPYGAGLRVSAQRVSECRNSIQKVLTIFGVLIDETPFLFLRLCGAASFVYATNSPNRLAVIRFRAETDFLRSTVSV